jgi:hypothetical protein
MVSNQQLLANFGLPVIPAMGMLLLPPCGAYSGMPNANLEDTWLILVPDDFFFSHLSNTPSPRGSDPRVKISCG